MSTNLLPPTAAPWVPPSEIDLPGDDVSSPKKSSIVKINYWAWASFIAVAILSLASQGYGMGLLPEHNFIKEVVFLIPGMCGVFLISACLFGEGAIYAFFVVYGLELFAIHWWLTGSALSQWG
jgi:hypothetical protein